MSENNSANRKLFIRILLNCEMLSVERPYFSVTDERGTFTITQVPAGTFTYHAWRPGGADLKGSVTIDARQPLDVSWP